MTITSGLDWKTSEGLGLGATETQVTHAYGKPDRIDKETKAETFSVKSHTLVYLATDRDTDNSVAAFEVQAGIVTAIALSDND